MTNHDRLISNSFTRSINRSKRLDRNLHLLDQKRRKKETKKCQSHAENLEKQQQRKMRIGREMEYLREKMEQPEMRKSRIRGLSV